MTARLFCTGSKIDLLEFDYMQSIGSPDYTGKVRDLYFIDQDKMLIYATDRVSAFDVVFNETIPGKGRCLNQISLLWFDEIQRSGLPEKLNFDSQIISSDYHSYPEPFKDTPELKDSSVLVKRTQRIDFECVVRGFLAGSGWKDYQKTGQVCGVFLPDGLQEASRLPEPVFTPATKAELGEHDENVTFEVMQKKLGAELAHRLREISLAIYNHAATRMQSIGILLCDTKLEFGLLDNKIVLIDELLTPDSSRYWNQADYQEGRTPPGYDKQYIRDFAAATGWNKKAPAPALPAEVIQKTQGLYSEIESKLRSTLQIQ